jgi:hypothetical protein
MIHSVNAVSADLPRTMNLARNLCSALTSARPSTGSGHGLGAGGARLSCASTPGPMTVFAAFSASFKKGSKFPAM